MLFLFYRAILVIVYFCIQKKDKDELYIKVTAIDLYD